jgi:hypothetical protein
VSAPSRCRQFVLDRVALDPHLVGDLWEEGERHGVWWFSRQVTAALCLNGCRDLRRHPWLAVRAIAVGCLTTTVCVWALRPVSRLMNGWVLDQLIVNLGSHALVMLWATDLHAFPAIAATGVMAGWVVGRSHRGHAGIVVAVTIAVAAWSLVTALRVALIPWTSMPGYVNLPSPLFTVLSRPALVLLCMTLGAFAGLKRPRLV